MPGWHGAQDGCPALGSPGTALASSFPEVCKPRYVSVQVCNEVCGERHCSRPLSSSLLNLSFLWLPPHAQPASQPSPAHVPFPWSQARLGWEANDNKQPPQPGRFLPGEEMGTWCRGGGAGAASSNRLVWLGGEASRPRGANEHCATGVSSSVPSLPCLRREQAAATTQRLARRSLRPARSGTRRQ